jgi:hypothetical protein
MTERRGWRKGAKVQAPQFTSAEETINLLLHLKQQRDRHWLKTDLGSPLINEP